MKSVALLLLRGGFFLPARVMARTKLKERGKKENKGAKAAKSKPPPGPPWVDAMSSALAGARCQLVRSKQGRGRDNRM